MQEPNIIENVKLPAAMREVTSENFQKICRCCAINKGEIDVFNKHIESEPLSNLIFTCTREMISKTDGLSRVVCNICMELIVKSYKFIMTFNEAQVNMRKWQILNNAQKNDLLLEEKIMENEKKCKSQESDSEQQQQAVIKSTIVTRSNKKSAITAMVEVRALHQDLNENTSGTKPKKHEVSHDIHDDSLESNSEEHLSEQEDLEDNAKRKPNKRMDVDPNLISGLDLQCFQCLMVFSSKAEMVKHHKITSHTMAPNYKCGICSKAISKRKAYWDHMAMHRHLKKKAVCEVCGAVVVSLHLKRHMLVHQDKTHMCQYCGKGYVQKNTLTEHVKRKHEYDDKDMNTLCFVCGKLCSDLKSLTTHLNTHAGEALKGLSHRCDDCGKYFLNAQSLSTHAYMAHKVTERIPKQHKRSKMIRQKSKRLPKGKKDKTESSQSEDKKTATKREPIECPVCKKMICYLGYKRHLTTHSGVKPHQCKYCPKSFRLYTSLKSHTYVHLDIKPFKCDVCGQQFRHYTTLKVHRRVHTGEKPYNCPVCTKGFRSASGLKRHQNQRQHHLSDMVKTQSEEENLKSSRIQSHD